MIRSVPGSISEFGFDETRGGESIYHKLSLSILYFIILLFYLLPLTLTLTLTLTLLLRRRRLLLSRVR